MTQLRLNTNVLNRLNKYDLAPDARRVALISALLWTYYSQTELLAMLRDLDLRTVDGRVFDHAAAREAIAELRRRELLVVDPSRIAAFRLVDALRIPLYRDLLETNPGDILPRLITEHNRLPEWLPGQGQLWPTAAGSTTIAYIRAKFMTGASHNEMIELRNAVTRLSDWSAIVQAAIYEGFDGLSFSRIDPTWRAHLTADAVASTSLFWWTEFAPVVEWAFDQVLRQAEPLPVELRLLLADLALLRGERSLFDLALAGIDGGLAAGVRAAQLVVDGQWAAGQAAFEAAFKLRRSEIGGTRRLLPETYSWFYVIALLAQATPKHLQLARKFCRGEGSPQRGPYSTSWTRWMQAIDVRLGAGAASRSSFAPSHTPPRPATVDDLWAVLAAAWLGSDKLAQGGEQEPTRSWRATFDSLRQRLTACHLQTLLRMLDGAEAVLDGRDPPENYFIAAPRQQWRQVLTSLQALAADATEPSETGREGTRLWWLIEVDASGRLTAIRPQEQKSGVRGWSKGRDISLARLAGDAPSLAPRDARVAQAIRPLRGYSGRYHLDLAAAIVALVGHPYLALAESPQQLVELTEGVPELELLRQGDHYAMRIEPPLRPGGEEMFYGYPLAPEERREQEALRLITLVRDGAQRLRLVRFTEAQQQAAQLISGRFAVPVNEPAAQSELDKALRALAGHFQVHADAEQAARRVDSDSRLHAELSPLGEHLGLRLVVVPLGSAGPRMAPGAGRRRLMAVLDGETVGTERDFAAEQQNLEAVIDALPFLEDGDAAEGWVIEDPELALSAVETLPTLPAVTAIDWPKGKSVRVVTVDAQRLGVRVSRERDWFRLDGQATLDEGLVIQLTALLEAAQQKSRFVPIGDGVYAALTRSLKQKLSDLAAVLESDKAGGKVPLIAAAWLDEVLDGSQTQASDEFHQALERLRQAQASQPQVPRLLQATLRPYQEDGYQWAMRLASAGMGACLADDMGLGKTLQALAVLIERAAGGPALVVAPTSVCGNWQAEIARFAPSLNARIYGEASEAEREQALQQAAAQDVVIVSYTLLLLAQERFAERTWHTLICDEAQAIKNAAAKRSQAVFDLAAGFRLALTGTPVENRLTDLWSIMRFANPGLLGNINRFNQRFAGPIERNRDREAQHVLKRLVGPFVLRRTKAEVLQELPARTELIIAVTPEAAEASHYEALRRLATQEIEQTPDSAPETQRRFNILAQLTRLRRAACDPRLVSPEVATAGAKVQAFGELATELIANGHKALVFSQFVDFLNLLREPLDAAGISYQYLDGATPAGERSHRVAAFQAGQGDLFLISLKAGGFGLNLTAADYVVITDPWWNPAAEDQAMGRAHRIGQLRPVIVYRLVSKGTVEERIVDLHHEKRALADSILAEGEATALPSTEDLVALIRGE